MPHSDIQSLAVCRMFVTDANLTCTFNGLVPTSLMTSSVVEHLISEQKVISSTTVGRTNSDFLFSIMPVLINENTSQTLCHYHYDFVRLHVGVRWSIYKTFADVTVVDKKCCEVALLLST